MTEPDPPPPASAVAPAVHANGAGNPGPEPLELPAGVHQLCGCGRSRHGWFCDGAHLGSGRVFYELRLEAPATVLLCRCHRSHRYPLCDGRHGDPSARPWWRWWR
jgi:CDGSH-type Zn-finger protein